MMQYCQETARFKAHLPALSAVGGVERHVRAGPVPGRVQVAAAERRGRLVRRVLADHVHRVPPAVPHEQLLGPRARLRQDEALVVQEVAAVADAAPHHCGQQSFTSPP